jgi:hypothetical protein
MNNLQKRHYKRSMAIANWALPLSITAVYSSRLLRRSSSQ